MIPTITHVRFERMKETFRRTLDKVPSECDLVFYAVSSDGGFTNFTGDSTRTPSTIHLKCLYKREFSQNERTKFGLHEKESGMIWLSPIHLEQKMGTWRINKKLFHVILFEKEYIVDRVLIKAPFYNSCMALEIPLIDMDEA